LLESRWLESRDKAVLRHKARTPARHPQRLTSSFEATSEDSAERLAKWGRDQHGVTVEVAMLPAIVHKPPSQFRSWLSSLAERFLGDHRDSADATLVFVEHRPDPIWRVTVSGLPQKPLTPEAIEAWFTMLESAPEDPSWRFVGWGIADVRGATL
jgi:hypothetical protein